MLVLYLLGGVFLHVLVYRVVYCFSALISHTYLNTNILFVSFVCSQGAFPKQKSWCACKRLLSSFSVYSEPRLGTSPCRRVHICGVRGAVYRKLSHSNLLSTHTLSRKFLRDFVNIHWFKAHALLIGLQRDTIGGNQYQCTFMQPRALEVTIRWLVHTPHSKVWPIRRNIIWQ